MNDNQSVTFSDSFVLSGQRPSTKAGRRCSTKWKKKSLLVSVQLNDKLMLSPSEWANSSRLLTTVEWIKD